MLCCPMAPSPDDTHTLKSGAVEITMKGASVAGLSNTHSTVTETLETEVKLRPVGVAARAGIAAAVKAAARIPAAKRQQEPFEVLGYSSLLRRFSLFIFQFPPVSAPRSNFRRRQ